MDGGDATDLWEKIMEKIALMIMIYEKPALHLEDRNWLDELAADEQRLTFMWVTLQMVGCTQLVCPIHGHRFDSEGNNLS